MTPQPTINDFITRLNARCGLHQPFQLNELADLGFKPASMKYWIRKLTEQGIATRLAHTVYCLNRVTTLESRRGVNEGHVYHLVDDHEHQQWLARVRRQRQQRLIRYHLAQPRS